VTSLTSRVLNSMEKLGCDCSEVCKTCASFSAPASKDPCSGCKHGSLGGTKASYVKRGSTSGTRETEEKIMASPTVGDTGNVSNTPVSQGEKRAHSNSEFYSSILSYLRSDDV
jgi:hypothetical protein